MSQEPQIVREIDLKEVRISLKGDGIVYVLLKANTVLDIELQMRMLEAYNVVTEKKLTPFINNMSNQEYKSTILELIEEPVKLSPVDLIKLDDNIKMSDIKELYNNWTGPTKEFVAALELLESKQKSTPISYAKIVK